MPKKKYFLSQADLSKLLKNYGGGYYWKIHKQLSNSGNVTYTDTQGGMLSINQLWDKETDKPYVMVYLSHSDGKIYRKDKWDWFDTIHQLYFDWTLQNGDYDLEFKDLEGKAMAKKRQSHTQKLEAELENYKRWNTQQEEVIKRLRENGENSFLNSSTYLQMKERIEFLDNCNKLSEIGRVNAEGRWSKFSDSERKLYEDNAAFLEHDGDSDYFIGIIECYREINEVHKYKDEVKSLEGKIQGYKDIIAERDKEIERLHSTIAELKHEQPTTTALSPDMQQEYDQAIKDRDTYKSWYDNESEKYQEECKKNEELSEEIENLKLQVSAEPTTDNISDDELDTLMIREIRDKATEEIDGKPFNDFGWFDSYESMGRAELVKRVHYVETISNRRKDQIRELKKELQSKRYEQYSEEDSITYNAALEKIGRLEWEVKQYQEWLDNSNKRNDELKKQVTELASATLTPEESIKVIEQNIEQDKELKKANQKKQGRPVTVTDTQRAVIFELHKNGHSIRAIAKQVGKSVGTVHRILNEQ